MPATATKKKKPSYPKERSQIWFYTEQVARARCIRYSIEFGCTFYLIWDAEGRGYEATSTKQSVYNHHSVIVETYHVGELVTHEQSDWAQTGAGSDCRD